MRSPSSGEMKRPQGRQLQIDIGSRSGPTNPPRRVFEAFEAKTKVPKDAPAKKRCAWILALLLILSAVSFVVIMVLVQVFTPEGKLDLGKFWSSRRKIENVKHDDASADMPINAAPTSSANNMEKISEEPRRNDPELGQDGTPTVAILSYHDYAVEEEGAKVREF